MILAIIDLVLTSVLVLVALYICKWAKRTSEEVRDTRHLEREVGEKTLAAMQTIAHQLASIENRICLVAARIGEVDKIEVDAGESEL